MIEIVPTILTRDPEDLQRKLEILRDLVDRVQIDIIDGFFLPEKTVGLDLLSGDELPNLKFDIHLMVKNPKEWLERCASISADQVIGQVEFMENQDAFIASAIEKGMKAGLALDVETPPTKIAPAELLKADLVLVMTRKAGFNAEKFNPITLEKVKHLRKMGNEYLKICVDGGIELENIKECIKAGADVIAIGGAIWDSNDVPLIISKIKDEIGER